MLTRIVLNNSRETLLKKSAKVEPIIARVQCAINDRCLPVLSGGKFRLSLPSKAPLGACFSVGVSGYSVMLCYTCWNKSVSGIMWRSAEELFLNLAEFDRTLDTGWEYREKPWVPWCATILLPHFIRLTKRDQAQVEELEPCIVWALMQSCNLV